jgi:hypothetical protein
MEGAVWELGFTAGEKGNLMCSIFFDYDFVYG